MNGLNKRESEETVSGGGVVQVWVSQIIEYLYRESDRPRPVFGH